MPPVVLTDEQLAFADEYAGSFKRAIEHVISNQPEDPLVEYLSNWLIVLGVLAHNNFTSIVTLIKANKMRSAWMFYRTLIDYHSKMRYYVVQSGRARLKYKAGNKKSPRNYLQMMHAWRDWCNATEKEFHLLKNRPLDLDIMSAESRAKFMALLQAEHEVYQHDSQHMMKVAEPEDEPYRLMQTTWLFQSGYLHGDQVAIPEIFTKDGEVIHVAWDSVGVSPFHVLAESVMYMQHFLESVEMVTGFAYGYYRMWRRARPFACVL